MKRATLSLFFILSIFFGNAQSNAGSDTTHMYYVQDVFSLWDGLATSISSNGTWYGFFNSSPITNADSIQITYPGQYNFYYVVTAPGFPSDTSIHVILINQHPSWTGVKEEEHKSINVYPNPSSGQVNVSSENLISKISLFSIDGKLVRNIPIEKLSANHYNIDIDDIESGMYVLLFTIEGTLVRKKIQVE